MAKPLHQLSPRHHRAVALRVAGESPQSIADSLGVERRTVYLWFSDPLVKEEVDRRVALVSRLVDEQLAARALDVAADLGDLDR